MMFEQIVRFPCTAGHPRPQLWRAEVVWYQAKRQYRRVRGLICGSPGPAFFVADPVLDHADGTEPGPFHMHFLIDPAVIAQAEQMVQDGRGRDVLPRGSVGD